MVQGSGLRVKGVSISCLRGCLFVCLSVGLFVF